MESSVRMPGCAPAKTVLGCLDGVSGAGKYQGEYSYLRDGANDHSSRRADKQNNKNNRSEYADPSDISLLIFLAHEVYLPIFSLKFQFCKNDFIHCNLR